MLLGKKIAVVMPAYNAEKTLVRTVAEINREIVDHVILVDDCSADRTVEIAHELNLVVIKHEKNKGYGGNQKTCYRKAIEMGADIVIMLHPDYQYTPKLIPALAAVLTLGEFEIALGSRMLGEGALRGGMPIYKFIANRCLTAMENVITGLHLAEFHTGYRAYSREVLQALPLGRNSDDFLFDNQILLQARYAGFRFAEVTCPTKYFPDASSMNFARSVKYGLGVLALSVEYLLARFGWYKTHLFDFPRIKSPDSTAK